MPFSVPVKRSRLAVILVLCSLGLVFASTAATVLAAGESQRRSAGVSFPTTIEFSRLDQSNAAVNRLVDSLVEPLFTGSGAGNVALRKMLELLTVNSEDTLTWDQYTSISELLNALKLPDNQRQRFEELWNENYRAADSALVRHDMEGALQYARENIASARWLLQKPVAADAKVGRELLAQGASLLARTALQDEQPFLRSAAQHLAELTQQSAASLETTGSASWAFGKSPDEKHLAAIAGNQLLLPAIRIASLTTVLAGACLEQREVLFGPSSARFRTLIALGDSLRDIPRAIELVAVHRESLLRIARPQEYMSNTTDPSATRLQTLLHLFVPPSVRARVHMCRALV